MFHQQKMKTRKTNRITPTYFRAFFPLWTCSRVRGVWLCYGTSTCTYNIGHQIISIIASSISKGQFTLVTSDCDHFFLESLIGWELSGSPTSFYTSSPNIEVIMGEYVGKWMRMWLEILHVQNRITFGGQMDLTARDSK